MAAGVVAGIVSKLYLNDPAIIKEWSLKCLGRIVWVCGQKVLQIVSLNTFIDVIKVPNACTSGE